MLQTASSNWHGPHQGNIVKYAKTALQLVAETVLIATVGSLFWMAIGQDVVTTHQSGSWELASDRQTFWLFFQKIVALYLLYRLVQQILKFIAKKTAKTVDNTMQDSQTYTGFRDRIQDVFQDKTVAQPERPQSNPTPIPTPDNNPGRCSSCRVPDGRTHLSGCQLNSH